jgi:hypothetical protein
MRSAETILKGLVSSVRPPRACAIVLTEWKSNAPTVPNWVAAVGNMEAEKLQRFNKKITELRETDPIIDWSEVKILVGPSRIAHWLSEVDDD